MQNDIRAKLIQVIEVEHVRGGEETSGIPSRWVKTYWDLKGNFLSESDPFIEELNRKGVSANGVMANGAAHHSAHGHATSTDVFRP
jgi:hypothetical protein